MKLLKLIIRLLSICEHLKYVDKYIFKSTAKYKKLGVASVNILSHLYEKWDHMVSGILYSAFLTLYCVYFLIIKHLFKMNVYHSIICIYHA